MKRTKKAGWGVRAVSVVSSEVMTSNEKHVTIQKSLSGVQSAVTYCLNVLKQRAHESKSQTLIQPRGTQIRFFLTDVYFI